jgi:hypothetical protein
MRLVVDHPRCTLYKEPLFVHPAKQQSIAISVVEKCTDGVMEGTVKATIEFAKNTGRLQPHEREAADREEAEPGEQSQL